ncbi:replication/maintenance protein RepL [Kitasatospora cineracea]|uniref:Replication protein RepL n=1 Tax=Kitasatospora cineracea TaxID=88074 RepID=A0A8G1UDE8_9ACTN|nr:replication/maintenance protein RepL [Kitasatospora cineracea]ROR34099.1 replication protein RepL [Kitasatospora cineracea]
MRAERRTGPAGAPPKLRPIRSAAEPELVSLLDRFGEQLAMDIATQPAVAAVDEVTVKFRPRRAAHDMAGSMGYSLTSNWFMAKVLARCIVAHRLSPVEVAVLLHMMGSQNRGQLRQTQVEMANEIGAARTSVNSAISRLCELNYIRRHKQRGLYDINPRLCFRGNGDEQSGVLAHVRAEKLASEFPDTIGPDDFARES